MNDHDVLQHLLNLEAEAAALVNEAQAEAERRIAQGETRNRARYDETYAREVKALEAAFAENTAAVREDYRARIEEYRESLTALPADMNAFSALAGKFLTGEP